jgi:hypothetical protein
VWLYFSNLSNNFNATKHILSKEESKEAAKELEELEEAPADSEDESENSESHDSMEELVELNKPLLISASAEEKWDVWSE